MYCKELNEPIPLFSGPEWWFINQNGFIPWLEQIQQRLVVFPGTIPVVSTAIPEYCNKIQCLLLYPVVFVVLRENTILWEC